MKDLFIDVETYSSVDLSSAGAYKYIASPDFEILIIGYAVDNGPVVSIDLLQDGIETAEFETFIELLTNPNIRKHAHNAVFERLAFKRVGYDIPAKEWYCTSVLAAYCGLPLSLDQVSKVLDLENKKQETGKLLIKYFSCPCKPTKVNGGRTRNYPVHAPEKWDMYIEYNRYDVLAEREIYQKLFKYQIPETERRLYVLDQAINDRGIRIDRELAESAIVVDTVYTEQLTQQARNLTHLDNPNSVIQLKSWIKQETGEDVDSFAKGAIDDLYDRFLEYPKVHELLDIRKKLAKTSIKKYYAMINCAGDDDRVRGTFQFYGANRTGRWAGRLLQLQNLSKNHVNNIELVRELIRKRDWETVEMLYDDVADILSQLVRTALVAAPGKVFSVADFSAIEARVISWLADEDWRMEVFKGDGKIYEATGSRMFNVPISSITKGSELRQKSKIAELALGYEGSVGAMKRMGGEKMGLSDTEMASLVRKWRSANPAIVEMWHDFDEASKEAVRNKKPISCTRHNIIFDCDDDYMTIQLPSGRKLFYKNPHFKDEYKGHKLLRTLYYDGLIQTTKQWGPIDTYGGKLTENIVQATARDLLGNSMLALADKGFEPVCHIHDEVLCEVPENSAQLEYEKMAAVMSLPPTWALDLPLRADGYITPFYKKD